ncbi:SMP-30/gluconolactonase/LRE family protein [Mucilaginibacter sp. JRF]|uniref:SMP-30/gluconolactonase/LRE family protein n=1 Tax=Mucilaginibacter sp. JRF TaxID=2780088 RepID=UPI00187F5060|nr:SMP-30/gluconolactonase/LRE family protein [Mucilaginibacter sp. JRF]MBE9584250.1 SMP-30/gluconolactonase/LRE family protein [Mucilaginibacter sp. JRF]
MTTFNKFIIVLTLISTNVLSVKAQTPRIDIKVKGLYPEGTVYDAKVGKFYVSSVIDGTIGVVDAQGNYSKFYEDKNLKSTYGMKIDPKKGLLWVCVSDGNYSKHSDSSTYKKMGRVIAVDLKTGKKQKDIDLAKLFEGKHFINDLTLDKEGNLFITDSFSPVIYKVDAKGVASVFAQSDLWKGEDIGLNGIAFHAGGFLLVDDGRAGVLYKVDINNPENITRVKIDQFFPGADGLLLNDQDQLILIQNKSVDKVFQLESTDNWQTAKVKAATAATDRFQQPSTATQANGKVFVLNSKLNELADPTKKPSPEFSLQEVVLKSTD